MAKAPSEEYEKFDALMGKLLKVSKSDLDAKVKAHQERQTANPRKPGRKRKAVTGASASAHDAS